MNKSIIAFFFLLSCGGGGSHPFTEADNQIPVAFIFSYNDKSKYDLAERSFFEALKFYEERTDLKFRVVGIYDIEQISKPSEYPNSGTKNYEERSSLIFSEVNKLGIEGIKVVVEPSYLDGASRGRADRVCGKLNVSYTQVNNFYSTWVLIAHELGHSLGASHINCEGCIMNTSSKEPITKISGKTNLDIARCVL